VPPNPHDKCDNLRATLTRRVERGAPAIGANAWRKKNARLTADMRHWCALAAQEDAAVLDDIVDQQAPGLAPAGLVAGGDAPPPGLTDAEVFRYGAIGLAGVAAVVALVAFVSRR